MAAQTRRHSESEVWQRFPIRRIEDLQNAVLGADLEPLQMAGPLGGSLAFCATRGAIFSSGLISGKVAIRGVPAPDAVTLVAGLSFPPGSRLFLDAARDGHMGLIAPGEELDVVFPDRSLHVAVTLSEECLVAEAERDGIPLDRGLLRRTGILSTPLSPRDLAAIRQQVLRLHTDHCHSCASAPDAMILRRMIAHCSRNPAAGRPWLHGRAQIVRRARDYIHDHLAAPLRMVDLVVAAGTSTRTLYRAFAEVLDDTPQAYVHRLRLHRIRNDLTSGDGQVRTIAAAAQRWSAGRDLGRLSSRYRALFGENPSITLAWRNARKRETQWM